MESTPNELEPYKQAQRVLENRLDNYLWMAGVYISNSIGACLGKNSKYPEKPLFQQNLEDVYLTQEEIDNREIQKMLMQEQIRMVSLNEKFGKQGDSQ